MWVAERIACHSPFGLSHNPFGLSLSKPGSERHLHFDRLSANGPWLPR
jgi:hypothetical protein